MSDRCKPVSFDMRQSGMSLDPSVGLSGQWTTKQEVEVPSSHRETENDCRNQNLQENVQKGRKRSSVGNSETLDLHTLVPNLHIPTLRHQCQVSHSGSVTRFGVGCRKTNLRFTSTRGVRGSNETVRRILGPLKSDPVETRNPVETVLENGPKYRIFVSDRSKVGDERGNRPTGTRSVRVCRYVRQGTGQTDGGGRPQLYQ